MESRCIPFYDCGLSANTRHVVPPAPRLLSTEECLAPDTRTDNCKAGRDIHYARYPED